MTETNSCKKRKKRKERKKTFMSSYVGSFGTVPGPIVGKYWTGNGAIWLVDLSCQPSGLNI